MCTIFLVACGVSDEVALTGGEPDLPQQPVPVRIAAPEQVAAPQDSEQPTPVALPEDWCAVAADVEEALTTLTTLDVHDPLALEQQITQAQQVLALAKFVVPADLAEDLQRTAATFEGLANAYSSANWVYVDLRGARGAAPPGYWLTPSPYNIRKFNFDHYRQCVSGAVPEQTPEPNPTAYDMAYGDTIREYATDALAGLGFEEHKAQCLTMTVDPSLLSPEAGIVVPGDDRLTATFNHCDIPLDRIDLLRT